MKNPLLAFLKGLASSLCAFALVFSVIRGTPLILSALANPAGNPTNGPCALGPTVGGTTDTSATVYCRMFNEAGEAEIRVAGVGSFTSTGLTLTGASGNSWSAMWPLTGLTPDTNYEVRIHSTIHTALYSRTNTFRTAPAGGSESASTIQWVFFGDEINSKQISGSTTTTQNPFAAAGGLNPQVSLFIGDLGHNDPATVNDANAYNWDARYAGGELQPGMDFHTYVESLSTYDVTPDDHDAGKDNRFWQCKNFDGSDCTTSYLTTYNKFHPHYPLPISFSWYHEIDWGIQLRAFLLDDRSFRDKDNDQNNTGVCMAPTMLGAEQFADLEAGLLQAQTDGVYFKVIVSPSAMNEDPANNGKPDSWASYPAEHQKLLDFIAANGITNVMVVSADKHSSGLTTDGTQWGGLPELSVPSVNIDLTGCTNNAPSHSCGSYNGAYVEVHPHSGFGSLTVTVDPVTGVNTLTAKPLAWDGTDNRAAAIVMTH